MATSKFAELVGDIAHGELEAAVEVEDTPGAAPESGSPGKESRPDTDTPPADPAVEPKPDAGAKPAAEPKPDGDGEQPPKPADAQDTAKTVEIDGKQYTLDEIREGIRGGLRQADYTQKRQADVAEREAAKAEAKSLRELARDIAADEPLSKFLSEHPEAIEHLMADPESTRKNLIGNPKAVDEFWADYEVLKENPRLASKLAKSGDEEIEPEEVSEEIRAQRRGAAVVQVAAALKGAVAEVAGEFPGQNAEEVEEYLLTLGGYDKTRDAENPDAVARAFSRLFHMMFVDDGNDGMNIDATLIRERFRQQAARRSEDPAAAADEHNKRVDQALAAEPTAASPKGGAPAPAAEAQAPIGDSFRSALTSILEGDLDDDE